MARAIQTQSAAEIEQSLQDWEHRLRDFVQERPFTAVAGGFFVGYVLGGGLTPRLAWLGLVTAGRMALASGVREAVASMARPEAVPVRAAGPGAARAARR